MIKKMIIGIITNGINTAKFFEERVFVNSVNTIKNIPNKKI